MNVDVKLSESFRISTRVIQRHDDWFTRFTIDDFLPQSLDHTLRSTFPNWILADLPNDVLNISVNHDDPSITPFLASNPEWRDYVANLTSNDFLIELISTFEPEIRRRYPLFWRPFLSRRVLRPENLYLTVLFSASRRGFRLTPHSDGKFKVVSLIHYFPESENKGQHVAGTRFFTPHSHRTRIRELRNHSNWSRGIRRFFPFELAPSFEYSLSRKRTIGESVDSTELSEFSEKFHKTQTLEYRPNRLTGFIKNAWSIHEVDLSEFPEDELRRAIIVNVRLNRSPSDRFLDQIDKSLSVIKRRVAALGAR